MRSTAFNSAASSGQISSCRFLYSAATPDFNFILKAWRCILLSAGAAFQPGAKADDDGREDERGDAAADEQVRLFAGAFPFMENPAPHRRKNDDAGHVQRPGGEIVFAHHGNFQTRNLAGRRDIRRAMFAAAGAAVMRVLLFDVGGEILIAAVVL